LRSCIVLVGRSRPRKATSMLPATSQAHILVINDAQAMIAGLPGLLADAGYRVSHSVTPLECPHIKDLMPDLIVQDLVVAGRRESCWHFLSVVRLDPDLMHIPLILCPVASEMITNPFMDANLSHLGVRVLRRPFAFNDLLRTVSEVLPAQA
jgi:CheY-like chemotaxis protein